MGVLGGGMDLGVTADGKVTRHYKTGHGYRVYVNRDGVRVVSNFHASPQEALTELALMLVRQLSETRAAWREDARGVKEGGAGKHD